MDSARNPFSPGAGSRPPQLAGREDIIKNASTALVRVKDGRSAQSQILLGLRGVGKTVLLNEIDHRADKEDYLTAFLEAPEDGTFIGILVPQMAQILNRLSRYEQAATLVRRGISGIRNFAAAFKLKVGIPGMLDVSVTPTPGEADSGNLEIDLTTLFLTIGQAAQKAGRPWAIIVDEVQYLKQDELAALIVALHRIAQKGLPVIMFAAGLPQMAKIAGDTKSYAERLFNFPPIGALGDAAAQEAIQQPILKEGAEINEDALATIIDATHGYPYFLQVWAHHAWELAEKSPITLRDVQNASAAARQDLDQGFFRVRLDRLTPAETDYVDAMARLGNGPYKSTDVAKELGKRQSALGPRRDSIIKKGMIYSTRHGELDFTVPLFSDFLHRRAA
mgnify:FL=1